MSAEPADHQTATAQIQHLRRTMDAVADRAAASDGWAAVSQRVRSGEPALLPVAPPGRHRTVRAFAAAAAVVLLAGIAIVTWTATRPEEDSGYTSTNGGPVQTDDDRDGTIAQGTFDGGSDWVLRLRTTDNAATTALSVTIGSADGQSGSMADPTATAFESIETLDTGGRHFASGLISDAVETIELRRSDGSVFSRADVVEGAGVRAWVAELTVDPVVVVALGSGGREIDRRQLEASDANESPGDGIEGSGDPGTDPPPVPGSGG